jgi:hypothetical protein
MSETIAKVCCMCQKDVSAAKHGKDKRGRYYCEPCFDAAKKRAAATAHPATETVQPKAAGVAAATTAAPVPETIPDFCPGCGAKVFANRKRCMKCGGDVLEMQRKAASRPKEDDRPAKEEVIATWFGRISRIGLAILVVGIVLFVLYGVKLMFMPGGLWDNYPTTREAAVREFLQHVATGTDASYEKAFMLISFRERTTGHSGEDQRYKAVFTQMHNDFAQKYGKDWLSKIKLENLGPNDNYADDEVDYKLTLGNDSYIIATQVQIDLTTATANMTLPRLKKPVFNENGKLHFGIIDVTGYKAHDKRRMVEIVGPGQPDRMDDAPRFAE